MIIQCPNCGEIVEVNDLGRKRLNIPLKNILESLRTNQSVAVTAKQFGCSQGHIFGVLKANGLKLNEVINQEEHEKGVA